MKKKTGRLAVRFSIQITLILAVILTIQNVLNIKFVRSEVSSLYETMVSQIAEGRTKEISNWLVTQQTGLEVFTKSDIVLQGNPYNIATWFETQSDLVIADFDEIIFVDAQGYGHSQTGNVFYVANKDFYSQIILNGAYQYITDPSVSQFTGRYSVDIANAAYDKDGTLVGCFYGTLFLDKLQNIVTNITLSENDYAFIVDGRGSLLAHPDTSLTMKTNFLSTNYDNPKMTDLAKQMIAQKSGYTQPFVLNDQSVYVAYVPIQGTPNWSLGIAISQSGVEGVGDRIRLIFSLVGIGMAFVILFVCFIIVSRIIKPINIVQKTMNGIAAGSADLSSSIRLKRNDEIGLLADGFNKFITKMNIIVDNLSNSRINLEQVQSSMNSSVKETSSSLGQMQEGIEGVGVQIKEQYDSVEDTAGAVTEIAQNIESLEKMIQLQASGVSQASAAIEQMMGNISSVTNSVEKMSVEFNSLQNEAKEGLVKQTTVNDTVKAIVDQSEMLVEANMAIESIASQTNMLAMNAAIEAAHAGDAGKGFSVVADEIRKLSETASEQSHSIGEELNKILVSIQTVVQASKDSEETFNDLAARITQTDIVVHSIRAAMTEQQEGTKQIFESLKTMNDSTLQVKTASSEMSAGNKSILEGIRHLQDSTSVIRESMTAMTNNVTDLRSHSDKLVTMSQGVSQSVSEIGSEIDQFKS